MNFLPREEKFYNSFISQAKLISEAAQILLDATRAGNTHLAAAQEKIEKLEQAGDEVIHETFRRLNQTFITPLDPEDIHSLSSHLDDVLDGIEDASYRMLVYRLEPMPEVAIRVCEKILACAKNLELAFIAMSNNEPLTKECIEINRLEEEVDKIVRKAIKDLFDNETNAIHLIKLKEVYELLETITDRCEDVTDVLENVIVKNS